MSSSPVHLKLSIQLEVFPEQAGSFRPFFDNRKIDPEA